VRDVVVDATDSSSLPLRWLARAVGGPNAESSEGTHQASEIILAVLCGMSSACRAAS
jgi:hypothetical protein